MINYLNVAILLALAVGVSTVLVLASYLLAAQKGYNEKLSPYECGFDPAEDARQPFQVQFYLVGILFIVMDLEVSLLFPWSLLYAQMPTAHLWGVVWFLLLLGIGLAYEWMEGGLEWEEV